MKKRGKRLFVVPRWSGRPDGEWYPWFAEEVRAFEELHFEQVKVFDMPNPDLPKISEWIPKIAEEVGSDPEELERTILVGHSIGCQAILRFLAGLPVGMPVSGVLCVAGFWTIDDVWETARPWLEEPLDLDRVRSASDQFVVLIADDDPVTSDEQANRRKWEERLGAEVRIIPGGYHFMRKKEPVILQTLRKFFL